MPEIRLVPEDEETKQRVRDGAREQGSIAKWDKEVLESLMSTPQGRHWMERLLARCQMFSDAYLFDGDGLGMAKRDGMGSIGRFLTEQIQDHTPNAYMRMMRERRLRNEIAARKADEAARASTPQPFAHAGVTEAERLMDEQATRPKLHPEEP